MSKKKCKVSVCPAGIRPDKRAIKTGVAIPSEQSVIDEIAWRMEHRQ